MMYDVIYWDTSGRHFREGIVKFSEFSGTLLVVYDSHSIETFDLSKIDKLCIMGGDSK